MSISPTFQLRPTWVEINLPQLRENFRSIRSFLPTKVRIIAILKANAYGHGSVRMARCLETCGVDRIGVAILEEALELQAAGISKPILLLNGFWEGQEEALIRNGLIPVVYERSSLLRLAQVARHFELPVRYHIKIDSGMVRLGIPWDRAVDWIEQALQVEGASCEGLLSHFSSAETGADPWTIGQFQWFDRVLKELERRGIRPSWLHMANSAALVNYPDAWYNAVRPGLLLYGVSPLDAPGPVKVRPVLSWKTRVMQVTEIHKGTTVGYGRTFRASRPSRIATIPVGYADGFNRLLSNRGAVLIRGQRAPIAGRISMDLTALDVTDIPGATVGDEVVLLGAQGNEEITVVEMARQTGSIPYEVLCRIGQRVPRIYLNETAD
jgi:alanine racemase